MTSPVPDTLEREKDKPVLEHVKPRELAKDLQWSEKRLRRLAKRLGACCVLGNRMILRPHHVEIIMKAVEPCPSNCTDEKQSGTTAEPLMDVSYEDRLRQRNEKKQRKLHPRSKPETGNVVPLKFKKR
jgi:hypothetical protein